VSCDLDAQGTDSLPLNMPGLLYDRHSFVIIIIDLNWKEVLNKLSLKDFYVESDQAGKTNGFIFNPIKKSLINQLSCLHDS
jgi:hypothetical protein